MDQKDEETKIAHDLRDECVSILRGAGWRLIAAVRPQGLSDQNDLDLAFASSRNSQKKLSLIHI